MDNTEIGHIERGPLAPFALMAGVLHHAGFTVVPSVRKRAVCDWGEWRTREQTTAEVRELQKQFGSADVAILLDAPRMRLVDLDVDGAHGEEALRDSGLSLPPTMSWDAKRGHHRTYNGDPRVLDPLPTDRVEVLPGVEFLAGGLVTIPPSRLRRWLVGPRWRAELPDEWVERARAAAAAKLPPPSVGRPSPSVQNQVPKNQVHSREYILPTSYPEVDLREVEGDPDFMPAVAAAIGFPAREGESFRCVLPGHEDRHPSASILRMTDGDGLYRYKDWHRKTEGRDWYSLAEVFAAVRSGVVRRLDGPELAAWKLRLLTEAGLLVPAAVTMPGLPENVSIEARRVAEGFRLLLSLKWRYRDDGNATAFTRGFASSWCGVGERQAGEAISELEACGVIRKEKRYGRLRLWLPGR